MEKLQLIAMIQAYTGIGISFGAGMVNLCFSMFGNPVFTFSIVNSGDWIDRQAAKATGETIAFINTEKAKVDEEQSVLLRNSLIAIISLSLVLIILVATRARSLQKKNTLLGIQKAEIEQREKEKEILFQR